MSGDSLAPKLTGPAAGSPPMAVDWTDKQLQRRSRIVEATLALLAQRSENVEVREVAGEANVALATVYSYFGSKEALFAEAYLTWCTRHWAAFAQDAVGDTDAARLENVLHRTIDAFAREPHMLRLINLTGRSGDSAVTSSLRASIDGAVELFETTMPGQGARDAHTIATIAFATLYFALNQWAAGLLRTDEVHDLISDLVRVTLLPTEPSPHADEQRKAGR
jgi:TetR/AcrR family transcriptional regulator, cholesterol catabolism regulator